MEVEISGDVILCYCPVTGRIGDIIFSDIPCLLSYREKDSRRTKFTVEAISLDKIKERKKEWVAINQNAINGHIDFFIRNDFLPEMKFGKNVKREIMLNTSKIDFCIDDDYLEIKMSLLEIKGRPHHKKIIHPKFNSFQRWGKQIKDLSLATQNNNRAVLCLVKTHNINPFAFSDIDGKKSEIKLLTKLINESKVECWQINLEINKRGIKLIDYFKLKSI